MWKTSPPMFGLTGTSRNSDPARLTEQGFPVADIGEEKFGISVSPEALVEEHQFTFVAIQAYERSNLIPFNQLPGQLLADGSTYASDENAFVAQELKGLIRDGDVGCTIHISIRRRGSRVAWPFFVQLT